MKTQLFIYRLLSFHLYQLQIQKLVLCYMADAKINDIDLIFTFYTFLTIFRLNNSIDQYRSIFSGKEEDYLTNLN